MRILITNGAERATLLASSFLPNWELKWFHYSRLWTMIWFTQHSTRITTNITKKDERTQQSEKLIQANNSTQIGRVTLPQLLQPWQPYSVFKTRKLLAQLLTTRCSILSRAFLGAITITGAQRCSECGKFVAQLAAFSSNNGIFH